MAKVSKTYIYTALIVGMIAISFSAIFVRWSNAPVSVTGMYRLVLTVVMMLPFLFKYGHEFRRLNAKDLWMLAASGVALALHFLLWMASLSYTTVASSTVLLTLEPVFVMIGSIWVFRERVRLGAVGSMALAMAGAILIGWGDFGVSREALFGDLLSLLGMLSVVFHMLLGQSLRKHVSSFVYSFSVFVVASVTFALYNVAAGFSFTGYPPREWVLFALLALVPTVFGHILFNWLIKYVGATTVSMSVLGEPVGASLLAWGLLSESIGAIQGAAAALLILGVWLFLRLSGSRHGEAEAVAEVSAVAAPVEVGGGSAAVSSSAASSMEVAGVAVAGAREK